MGGVKIYYGLNDLVIIEGKDAYFNSNNYSRGRLGLGFG